MTDLTDLRAAYDADHHARQRAAMCPSVTPSDVCRYCARFWRPWRGSLLDGHALCVVSDSFMHRVCERLTSEVTFPMMATALGVGVGTVRAWYAAVKMRRAA